LVPKIELTFRRKLKKKFKKLNREILSVSGFFVKLKRNITPFAREKNSRGGLQNRREPHGYNDSREVMRRRPIVPGKQRKQRDVPIMVSGTGIQSDR